MRKIATVATAALMLALPATAFGKTIRQTGFVKGDKAATVKLRVKVHGNDPVKVGGFKAKNVTAKCDKGPIRITLTALTPVKVDSDNGFKVRLGDGNGGVLRISGTVKDDGRRTVGNLKTNDFQSGKQTCKVPKQGFATSA
jgi:hypothetical protein